MPLSYTYCQNLVQMKEVPATGLHLMISQSKCQQRYHMPSNCLPILQSKILFCHFLGQHVSSQHEECYATGNQPYAWLVPSALSYFPSCFNQFREKINRYIFSTLMRWKNFRLVHLEAVDTRVLLPLLTTISELTFLKQ